MLPGYVEVGATRRRSKHAAYAPESFCVAAGVMVPDRSGHFAVITYIVAAKVEFLRREGNAPFLVVVLYRSLLCGNAMFAYLAIDLVADLSNKRWLCSRYCTKMTVTCVCHTKTTLYPFQSQSRLSSQALCDEYTYS